MKDKRIYRFHCLCVGIGISLLSEAMPVDALSRPDNGLLSDEVIMEWQDSTRLKVAFPLTAGDVYLTTDDRLVVTPVVCSASGQEMALPAVEFAGKRNKRYFDRQAVLDGVQRLLVYGVRDSLYYTQVLSVEPWMRAGDLKLELRRDVEDCCQVTSLQPLEYGHTRYFEPQFDPVVPWVSVAEQIAVHEPVLVPMSEYKPFNPDVPLRKMKDALYVHFPLGKSTLLEDFRTNASTLHRILDMVKRIEADTLSQVVKVRIIGLASPEGPLALNERLSHNRAQVLKDYLVDHGVNLPDSAYELVGGGEAWADLLDVIMESDLYGKEELENIIRHTPDLNKRERLIRRHNGGHSFDYLLQRVFSDQRNSGYIQVYYEAVPDEAARLINKAVELVRNQKGQEAVELIADLNDNRKWNALGSALYLCGKKQEALECFRKAVDNGNEGAQPNVKALEELLGVRP